VENKISDDSTLLPMQSRSVLLRIVKMAAATILSANVPGK
jgi:hypothetical protein